MTIKQAEPKRQFSEVRDKKSFTRKLPIMAKVLMDEIALNDASPQPVEDWERVFHTGHEDYSVQDFLIRLCKYSSCAPTVFPLTLIYLGRFTMKTGVKLTSSNACGLLLSAFIVACKWYMDLFYINRHYANILGVTSKQAADMEAMFLVKIDWEAHVSLTAFSKFVSQLENLMESSSVQRRHGQLPMMPTPPGSRGKMSETSSPCPSLGSSMASFSTTPDMKLSRTIMSGSPVSALRKSIRTTPSTAPSPLDAPLSHRSSYKNLV